MKTNTLIYLWVEPMVMNHKRCDAGEKVYFECIVEGKHDLDTDELEKVIDGKVMDDIMYDFDIDRNWDYRVVSGRLTSEKPATKIVEDYDVEEMNELFEEELKVAEKEISKLVKSKKPLALTKSDVEIQDGGIIEVSHPALAWKEKINFPKIWETIEKDFIGKIKEGDTVTLTDDAGNKIFEIVGGSFLNVALADMLIYDPKKKNANPSIFNRGQGLKGGLYVRDNGDLDIGDAKRTFFLTIHTNNLLKASLKLNKSLMDFTQLKLLPPAEKK